MKILVVGVFNENSTNNGIANGFNNAGHNVSTLDYRKFEGEKDRDGDIITICRGRKFDLVFFCKCNGVDVRVLRDCDCPTFLWYMDPLNGNYNDELKEKIRVADYVGVAKWEVYLEAKKLNPNTHFLIEGFDPVWDYPIENTADKQYAISFIGNPYGNRAEWLDGVTILSNRYNIEHAEAVGRSRININLTDGGGPSDRVYKILAAGGFCLSEFYPHVEKYGLVPEEDLAFFDTPEDMVNGCNYFLSHLDARNKIAEHGYQTVQKFSRDNLAKQIIEIVDGSVSGRESICRTTQDKL